MRLNARLLREIAVGTGAAARPEAVSLRIVVQFEREAAADLVQFYRGSSHCLLQQQIMQSGPPSVPMVVSGLRRR